MSMPHVRDNTRPAERVRTRAEKGHLERQPFYGGRRREGGRGRMDKPAMKPGLDPAAAAAAPKPARMNE